MNNELKVFISGDFYPGGRIENLIVEERYDEIFNDLLPIIKSADLAITNLECPLLEEGKKIVKSGPALKGLPDAIKALKFAGFELVTLANNHIMDYGDEGLLSTTDLCDLNSINYIGAGRNLNEASEIYYTKIKGKILAFLNLTENEFSTTHGNYPGANPHDLIKNYNDIIYAKIKADYVFVIYHGGHEMYNLPSPRMVKTFRFFADAGADAIFSHHSHCYTGYEVYNGAPIFYGLGNFVFDSLEPTNKDWNIGYAVELKLRGKVNFRIIPYEQCSNLAGVWLLDDKDSFRKSIEHMNLIIKDDEVLISEFERYCQRVQNLYSSYLEPHSIRLLHFLRNRKFIPSLLSKKKKTLYLNMIRCESHKDVLLNLLNKK